MPEKLRYLTPFVAWRRRQNRSGGSVIPVDRQPTQVFCVLSRRILLWGSLQQIEAALRKST